MLQLGVAAVALKGSAITAVSVFGENLGRARYAINVIATPGLASHGLGSDKRYFAIRTFTGFIAGAAGAFAVATHVATAVFR